MFAGFASLAQALQGAPDESEEESEEQQQKDGEAESVEEDEAADDEAEGDGGEQPGPALSFWGVATALTATVKAKTAEVLTAVQETDWKAELEAFKEGAREDADMMAQGADFVVHKAMEAAEQLPGTLEHLPESATVASTRLQRTAEVAGAVAKEQSRRGLASLAGLGQKLVLGTSDLFDQISHAIQNEMSLTEGAVKSGGRARGASAGTAAGQARYSRFDADVAAMQRDSGTYCDEPEDTEEFEAWLADFSLVARKSDIDRLIAENTFMSELQARIVPLIVEYDAFWTRYFYRLHKLEQKHQQFVQLTQRAQQQEEEVGWSSDDEVQPLSLSASAAVIEEEQTDADQATASPAAATPAEGQGNVDIPAPEAASTSTRSSSPSDGSATLQSDASLSSSGEHWQVVSSPRQKPAAPVEAKPVVAQPEAPHEQLQADTAPVQAASAKDTEPLAVSAAAGTVVAASPASHAAPAAAAKPAVAAEPTAAGTAEGDDELSDWGEDDDAALEAAVQGAGGEGGSADPEESWGSDWE